DVRKAVIFAAILAGLLALLPVSAQQTNSELAELKADAKLGDADAQDKLADIFRKQGDIEEAVAWYRRAAPQGNLNSQYQLSHLLITWAHNGTVPTSTAMKHASEALPYLLSAAAAGHKAAQYELGQLYREGKLITRDPVEAYKWLCLAADSKNPTDLTANVARSARDTLVAKMSAEQMDEGNQRIKDFLAHPEEAAPATEPTYLQKLKLQGITSTSGHPLAIINGQTLGPDESTTLKLDARPVTLRCLAITSNSVTVAVGNRTTPKTLNLP
ncbi:MAG TPA: tetratricopeptide repeat protein, partial [Verrucomicrobiae bacterium]|nr:tetratricopeptide repeat protein [Verrucomicrobiae bacterium]